MIARRGLLTGLASLIVAPAVVRATSLMPISVERIIVPKLYGWVPSHVLIWSGADSWRCVPIVDPQRFINGVDVLGAPIHERRDV